MRFEFREFFGKGDEWQKQAPQMVGLAFKKHWSLLEWTAVIAFCLLAICVALFVLRWGFPPNKFVTTMEQMSEQEHRIGRYGTHRTTHFRTRNAESKYDPRNRHEAFRQFRASILPETIFGPFFTLRSPFEIYRLMLLFRSENEFAWQIWVDKEG